MESSKQAIEAKPKKRMNPEMKEANEIVRKQLVQKVKNRDESAFINQQKDWTSKEHFSIPEDILKGINDELGFKRPSNIQAAAIPLILKKDEKGNYEHLIIQSNFGSGKTGAYTIGSLLRIDSSIKKIQVIVLGYQREIINQISEMFINATLFSEITVKNCVDDVFRKPSEHILITTLGKLNSYVTGRNKVDLSALKIVVIDFARLFFDQIKSEAELNGILDAIKKLGHQVQFIVLSDTYNEQVQYKLANLIEEANQISQENSQLQLTNIINYEYKCEPRGKIDFIKQVFDTISMTQTIIFINTLDFAETVFNILKHDGYKVAILFSKMSKEERDEIMIKFRERRVNVLITTNIQVEGIYIPNIGMVINFDVPKLRVQGKFKPDYENFLQRIVHAGRFGKTGIALTLYDNENDELIFQKIITHYEMDKMVQKLDSPRKLKDLLEELIIA
ncbi:dead-box atp-dependent rna helicase 38 [Stylonychia lemnae]|uniref:RNA helicase n=1 Tax=Stylonychia lemnae TaxID=5949 RepID=A0A078AQM5_STYLE|nr:dead-box atp-dependent rna helicase 38 [Stylonychia lemnae]|eukprot:CDW84494.1 dead-box atp-dependent rna helicase 38 [Stylonychia lemnae]